MTIPSDALPQSDARVLVAVIRCAGTEGRCTVRDVADLAGYQSFSYTHLVLRRPLVRPMKVQEASLS